MKKRKEKLSLLHLKKETLEKLKYKKFIRDFVSFKKNKFFKKYYDIKVLAFLIHKYKKCLLNFFT